MSSDERDDHTRHSRDGVIIVRVLALLGFLVAAPMLLGAANAPASATSGLAFKSARALRWCTNNVHDYAVDVTIVNRSSATSPQRFSVPALSVHDSATPADWSGVSGVPAIPPNHSANLMVALTPRSGKAAVTPTLPLVITLDRGQFSVEKWPSGAVVCRSPKAFARRAGAAPVPAEAVATVVHINVAPPVIIPQPKDLTYTTNPKTCAQHAGLLAAILCPDIINKAGMILLVWRWNAGSQVDGFHIYRTKTTSVYITGHPGTVVRTTTNTLIDTQTDASMTIRAIKPFKQGECFIVTAYRGKIQSDPSNRFCVGETAFINTPMGVKHLNCLVVTKGEGFTWCDPFQGVGPHYHYALTWSWSPCAAPGCLKNIAGWHVYEIEKGAAHRIFTQTELSMPAADGGPWHRGTCYEVTAFKGSSESQASNQSCVTAPMPTPPPTPKPTRATSLATSTWPSHADYHITADAFPYNIDLQNGGSVTFYNDDVDNHTVSTCDAGFGCMGATLLIDEVLYPGQSYTLNLPTWLLVGNGYRLSSYQMFYFCVYHGEGDGGYATPAFNPQLTGSMEGIITVHL